MFDQCQKVSLSNFCATKISVNANSVNFAAFFRLGSVMSGSAGLQNFDWRVVLHTDAVESFNAQWLSTTNAQDATVLTNFEHIDLDPDYVDSDAHPRQSFVCPHCGKSYFHKGSLNRHLKVECGKIPQESCPICSKSFHHKHHVERHMKSVHFAEMAFNQPCATPSSVMWFSPNYEIKFYFQSIYGLCTMCLSVFGWARLCFLSQDHNGWNTRSSH